MPFTKEIEFLRSLTSIDADLPTSDETERLIGLAQYLEHQAEAIEQEKAYKQALALISGITADYKPVPVEVHAPILSNDSIIQRVTRHHQAVEKVIERNVKFIRAAATMIVAAASSGTPLSLTTAIAAAKPLAEEIYHLVQAEIQ